MLICKRHSALFPLSDTLHKGDSQLLIKKRIQNDKQKGLPVTILYTSRVLSEFMNGSLIVHFNLSEFLDCSQLVKKCWIHLHRILARLHLKLIISIRSQNSLIPWKVSCCFLLHCTVLYCLSFFFFACGLEDWT